MVANARAYVPVMPTGSFFVGRTAAVIHGAPIDPASRLEVASFAPAHCPRGKEIDGRKVSRRLARTDIVDGMPVSDPVSTWAMLAGNVSIMTLVIVGNFFVRIPRGEHGVLQPENQLAAVDELREAIAGRAHAAELRAAIARVRVGISSPLESEYWIGSDDFGLPEPEIDYEVRNENGRLIGISEFAYPQYKIVVEIEGDQHRTSKAQWDRDIEKYREYEAAGWKPIRLTARHVRDTARGVRIVSEALVERGWRDPRWRGIFDADL